MIHNRALELQLNQLLSVDSYKDYAPNGLQVEGKEEIQKIVCGVTASMALIEQAIAHNADAIIVHHGYFWKGEASAITGMKRRRIKALLEHDINLYGYHLPLDGHCELGNNAQLGMLWGIENASPVAPHDLLWMGNVPDLTVDAVSSIVTDTLGCEPLVIDGGSERIKRIAWCSGGAQDYVSRAADLGADAYISGEISERTYHEAKEYGIHYFAAGHHATECGGIAALAKHLSKDTSLSVQFIDIPNPV